MLDQLLIRGAQSLSDKQHLAILKDGVRTWNLWRREHPDIRPNLRESDLSNANLVGVNLLGCDLCGTDLSGSCLRGASLKYTEGTDVDLTSADLVRADITRATLLGSKSRDSNFSGANLTYADLRYSDLRGSILVETDLTGTIFGGTLLAGTNFARAIFGYTILAFTDLSHALNLDVVKHKYRSMVDIETVAVSHADIPEDFLRGAGVSEDFLRYAPSFVGQALDFYSAFISYSHRDKPMARRLHDQLQSRGIRCWLDEHQMLPGDDIYDAVDRAIRLWDKVILCCSEASLKSWWVNDEIDKALEKERQLLQDRGDKVLAIIPLNLDGYLFEWRDGRAATLRKRLAGDFTGWERDNTKFETQFERVISALRTDRGARERAPKSKL
jgi:uncharacterized protein YjbI with pentapeptide repeats